MKLNNTINIDEGQRQMVLMALAHLAVERPGWDFKLNETALLMDNRMDTGRAQMFEEFKLLHQGRGRIRLQWVWIQENGEWVARVPAIDHVGSGFYQIHAIQRPGYCDRGKWHVLIEPQGVAAPDEQEGFPRYYFRLENLKQEMEQWVNEREGCKAALEMETKAA